MIHARVVVGRNIRTAVWEKINEKTSGELRER
jgi:hypothetical protein